MTCKHTAGWWFKHDTEKPGRKLPRWICRLCHIVVYNEPKDWKP